jgi:hypothetical protein
VRTGFWQVGRFDARRRREPARETMGESPAGKGGLMMTVARASLVTPVLAVVLALFPGAALAALILVEDNRSVEMDYEGDVTRLESPGDPSWNAELNNSSGSISVSQTTTISPTAISGSSQVLVIMDGGNPQEAVSSFDIRFRVDEPTSISLTGQFEGDPAGYSTAGPLFLVEGSALIFSAPNEPHESFSFARTLAPGFEYHLTIEASIFESNDRGAGIDLSHGWQFALTVPESPGGMLVSLMLAVVAITRWRSAD